ncbi:Smr/MutS family protein [Roseateles sp.]|uniref:Smr/MutS family protein n=1 Tax=Roseateles sp. TaxID=1971397 RepID=UPI00286C359B|nr:Smr/MutS family protein [Roseateles sp.]
MKPPATPTLHSLQELKLFQRELAQRRQAAEEQAARLAAALLAADQEWRLFELSVGAITPLPVQTHAALHRILPSTEPLQRAADERLVMQQALSDDFDVESLLETDDSLSFRRPEISQEVLRKLRRGHWSLQAQLDLHGLRTDQAREALGTFVQDCARRGLRCVRVVHGKGHGSPGREPVLKARVRRWLVQKQQVLGFVQARASDGGSGALMVLLQHVA